jgi:hypothetical protein
METTSFELQIVTSQPLQNTAANIEFGFAVMPSFATVRYDRIAQLTTFDDPRFEASISHPSRNVLSLNETER